jgi:hypothetical protein
LRCQSGSVAGASSRSWQLHRTIGAQCVDGRFVQRQTARQHGARVLAARVAGMAHGPRRGREAPELFRLPEDARLRTTDKAPVRTSVAGDTDATTDAEPGRSTSLVRVLASSQDAARVHAVAEHFDQFS